MRKGPVQCGRQQVLMKLSYRGRKFHGVPPQPGLLTVSDGLQSALVSYFGQRAKALVFTARTDRGVNADVNYATGWFQNGPRVPAEGVALAPVGYGLDCLHVMPTSNHTFARTLSVSKSYTYRFRTGTLAKSREDISFWDILPALDPQAMHVAAQVLVGEHDFSSFQIRGGENKGDNFCLIQRAYVASHGEEIVFSIEGARFLRRMVRILAGTLAEIGCGLMPVEEIYTLLKKPGPSWVGPTAPARGLTLSNVKLKREFLMPKEVHPLNPPEIGAPPEFRSSQ